jgi:hypothetical protein
MSLEPPTKPPIAALPGTEAVQNRVDNVDTLPPAPVAAAWKSRLYIAFYFAACAIATIGWLIALGWAAIALAEWIF